MYRRTLLPNHSRTILLRTQQWPRLCRPRVEDAEPRHEKAPPGTNRRGDPVSLVRDVSIGTRASAKPPHRVVTEGLPSTTPLSVAHLMQPGRIDALTGVRTTQQL